MSLFEWGPYFGGYIACKNWAHGNEECSMGFLREGFHCAVIMYAGCFDAGFTI